MTDEQRLHQITEMLLLVRDNLFQGMSKSIQKLQARSINELLNLPNHMYTIDPSSQTDWRNAAIRVGEELSSVGPDGYYNMTAEQWLDWAMAQKPRGKNSLAQPEHEHVIAKGHCCPHGMVDTCCSNPMDCFLKINPSCQGHNP